MKNKNEIIELTKNAENLAEQGDLEAAIILFEEILSKESNNLNALQSLGNIYYHQNKIAKAITYYLKTIIVQPDQHDIIMSICYLYKKIEETKKSETLLDLYFRNKQEQIIDFAKKETTN